MFDSAIGQSRPVAARLKRSQEQHNRHQRRLGRQQRRQPRRRSRPPTSVTATAGNTTAQVSWTAPANGGSAITGYTVTSSGGQTATLAGTFTTASVTGLTNGTAYTFTVTATNAVGISEASASSSAVTPVPVVYVGATFVPLTPTRVLDTRDGTGASAGQVGADSTVSVQITGVAGVPVDGVTAVVMNVTAVAPSASGHITVYPSGEARPLASSLNPTAGVTSPNLVVVKLGVAGKVSLYNAVGATHLIADIAGYYTDTGTGATFQATTPSRILDTRDGTGAPAAQVGSDSTISVQITGVGGVPVTGVTAVVLNVTAVAPSMSGHITVYPSGEGRPLASNLNPTAGVTDPNLVVVKVGAGGKVNLYNAVGAAHLLADVAGYFTDAGTGATFQAATPSRILDTRDGTGVSAAVVGPDSTISLQIAGSGGVPVSGVTAVVLNVTAVAPSQSGHITVYPSGQTRPLASNLNPTAGVTAPNLVVVKVGSDGKVNLYNAVGTTHLIADVAGYYTD